jgi:GntR family transcriptional regulator/MocR family aminotransferase
MWSIGTTPARGAGADALFVRIAGAVIADIRRGVRRAGDRLPSTRALAGELGVHRNTVVAAYDELVAQGWVVSRGAAGTFVAGELPTSRTRAAAAVAAGFAARPAFELAAVPPIPAPFGGPDARYHLSVGVPDPRLFPRAAMARAYRGALRSSRARALLAYGDTHGALRLRTAIAALLRDTRAIPATAEHILITRGSQMALDLAARALVRAGDVVAIEELGYQPAWRAFRAAGARLAAVPLDEHGLVVDALPPRVRALYVTPHHQYPTTVLLSPARRLALLERAHRERFAIVEDDYDHEFHYDGRPVAPLASADRHGSVLYVGTLSKILAPGLRLGFIAAPVSVIATLAAIRAGIDRQGDHVIETAVAELVEDGEVQRHAHKSRRIYHARRDAFAHLLARDLGGVLAFTLPAGGMTLWARVAADVALPAWQARAAERGVAFAAAAAFAHDGRARPFIRLGFARHDERELAAAVKILAATLRARR